ncbi:MAG: hypothetical protein ACI8RZ_000695 [Myxococcota bacterium]|jgi:hypothetical protein
MESLFFNFDTASSGLKIDQVIRLTRVVIEITIDEKHQRDFTAGLSKIETGIERLRRLPGTAEDVSKLTESLTAARRIQDPSQGAATVTLILKDLKAAVKRAEDAWKKEQKELKEEAARRRAAMGDEILYESLKAQVQEKLVVIDNEPMMRSVGLDKRIDAARQARGTADDLLAKGKTTRAVTAMQELLIECGNIIYAWNSQIGEMQGSYKKLLKKTTAYNQLYRSSEVLTQKEKENLSSALDLLILPLVLASTNKKSKKARKLNVSDVKIAIKQQHETALAEIESRTLKLQETTATVKPAVARLRLLLKFALGRELAEPLKMASDAERHLEQREYEAAATLARKVTETRGVLEPVIMTAYGDWNRALKEVLPSLTGDIQLQKSGELGTGFNYPHAPELLLKARFALEDGVMSTRTCTEGVADVVKLADAVKENHDLYGEWAALEVFRRKQQQAVSQNAGEVKQTLQELTDKMTRAMSRRDDAPDDWTPFDVGGLQEQLTRALSEWDALCKTAATEGDLATGPTLAALNKIFLTAKLAMLNPDRIEDALDKDLLNAAKAHYNTAESTLSESLPGWEIYPLPHATQMRVSLESGRESFNQTEDTASIHGIAEKMEEMIALGKNEESLTGALLEDARGKLAQRARAARTVVATLVTATEKGGLLTSSSVVKIRQRCRLEATQLSEQIDTISGRHSSDLLDVFHEGTIELGRIEERAKALMEICRTGQEGMPPMLPETFAKVVKTRKSKLESKDLKQFRPSDHYLLKQKIETIEGRLSDGEHTSRIEAAIAEWDVQLKDAMALVARDLVELEQFKQLHQLVSSMLTEKKKLFKKGKDFYKKLSGDLKSAMQLAETEDGIRGADTALRVAKAAIERIIMAATSEGRDRGMNLGDEIKQGQTEALAGKERIKDLKAAWEARLGAFEDRWLPKLPLDEEDVSGLVKIAKKSAGQEPPDYEAAKRYLQMAADRAMLAIQFPDGPVSMSLSRLPKEEKKWSQAVAQYRSSFDPLKGVFDLLEDPKAKRAAIASLDELKLQFDPSAFGPTVQRICAKGTDVATRAKARETALAQVRRYRDVLVKDARFRLLSKHPYKTAGAWKGHLILQRPLIELEHLLLMAVPTN